MRYVVIGAGAVGGTIGGRLWESGREVVLVARGAHLAALRASGLRLITPDGTTTLPVPAVAGPDEVALRADDVLVLAVKVQDAAAALDAWAGRPVAGGGTAGERLPLICAQNGVDGERQALRRFRQVLATCLWLPATFLEPGVIAAPCAPLSGILHLSHYPAAPPAADHAGGGTQLAAIAADLRASRFGARLPPDVMPWKYAKLLVNLGNAVDAIVGQDTRTEEDGEVLRQLHGWARAEGEAVLAAAGIEAVSPAEQRAVRGDRMTARPISGAARGSSSWQSLVRGTGTVEADYLNGEITLLGRLHGVPAPVNATLQRIADELAREGRPPGSLTVGALRAECDAARAG